MSFFSLEFGRNGVHVVTKASVLLGCPFPFLWLQKSEFSCGYFFFFCLCLLAFPTPGLLWCLVGIHKAQKENPRSLLPHCSLCPEVPELVFLLSPSIRIFLCLFYILCLEISAAFSRRNREKCVPCLVQNRKF